ncbi:MAG: tetratricopeptide repeat protein [Planctomycetes bacterium]|nr:tetratricopeptide repeat protein [Planctomycetota bacterium]
MHTKKATNPPRAIEAYRAAIELDGNYVASYVNLGQLLIDVDVNEARGILEKAVELDPNDSLALYQIFSSCASLEKNEDQAMLHFKKALEVQPNFREAHHALSLIYRRGNDAEAESQEELAKDGRKALVRNDPIRFDLSTRLRSEEDIAKEALENARKGKPEAAARFLLATMKKGYRGAPIHRALGEVLMMVGKYDEALVQFREALKIAPKSTTTKLLICTAQIEVGELDQAEITLNEIAEKKPKMHEVVNRLGVIDVKRGRLTEAEKRFRSALDMEPGNGIYRFSLAQCIALQGRDAEALEATDRTLEITPNDANVHLLRGRVLINMEHMQEAASSLQEALDLNPSLEQAYVLLAGVQRDENKHAESIRSLESGQKQLPDSLVIANDLAFSLAACPNESLRDPQRAISLARQICDATFQQDVNFLDTLATAYSAAREYAKAAEVITKAIERAETLNADPSVINALKSRRTEYEARLSGKS